MPHHVLTVVLLVSFAPVALGTLDGQVCTNVSYVKPLSYKDGGDVCCTTKIIEPLCVEDEEEICLQVEEMKCEIATWSECSMRDCPVECTLPEPVPRIFQKMICNLVPHVITHTKIRPVCHNETRLNCITLWTVDDKGNKVWAGKDQCEEVSWLKCDQEAYQANFTTMKSVCEDDDNVPYDTCKNETSISNQMCMDCKPMAVPKCWTEKREECRQVTVKHCKPQTKTECNTKVRIPWQEWVHQEKCLFAEDGTLSNSPAPTYQSSAKESDNRDGRGSFHNSFPIGQHHNHHHDEYGFFKEPEAYGTEPSLDYPIEQQLDYDTKPDLDARRGRNLNSVLEPIGIINERVEYDPRKG